MFYDNRHRLRSRVPPRSQVRDWVLVPLACGLAQCVEQQFGLQLRQLGEHLEGGCLGRSVV